MLFALTLFFFRPLSFGFFIFYLLAGASDILDGYLARRLNAESRTGAYLDSAADFLLFSVVFLRFLPILDWPHWLIFWIAAVGLIRVLAATICYIRFHRIAFLHTYSNKATGSLLVLFPVLFWLVGLNVTGILLCSVASFSALEELFLQLSSSSLDLNRISIFTKAKTSNIQ